MCVQSVYVCASGVCVCAHVCEHGVYVSVCVCVCMSVCVSVTVCVCECMWQACVRDAHLDHNLSGVFGKFSGCTVFEYNRPPCHSTHVLLLFTIVVAI